MARRRNEEEGSGDTWLNTYADMITLVLTFFIALFSMSTLEQEKFQAFAEGLGINLSSAPVASQPAYPEQDGSHDILPSDLDIVHSKPQDFSELYEYVKAYIEKNQMGEYVQAGQDESAVYIRFTTNVFFDPDSYYLKPESKPFLNFLGDCFNEVIDEIMMINIYGHTAAVDDPYYPVQSLMLSSERAANVAIFFQSEKGIEGTLLNPIGQGNSFPIADNGTAEGRARNRRVEVAIYSNKAAISSTEEALKLLQGTFDSAVYPAVGGVKEVFDSSAHTKKDDGESGNLPDSSE